jgi:hypothetical protein
MQQGSPVLAMYDFSAKQSYIYRTNKIREIVGASYLIKNAFEDFLDLIACKLTFKLADSDKLLSSAGEREALSLRLAEVDPFKLNDIGGTKCDCAVVYEGGGSLFMVFDTEEKCVTANKAFSRMLYEKAYGLNLICALVPVTEDFQQDIKNLYTCADSIKKRTPQMHPVNVLPYTMIDRTVSLPVERREKADGIQMELSRESKLKREAYEQVLKANPHYGNSEKILDELTIGEGDSLLACIYIDGNAMGEHIKSLFDNCDTAQRKGYDFCAKTLRESSAELEDIFQKTPLAKVAELMEKKNPSAPGSQNEDKYWWRLIISGGDEMTLVCNAHCALSVVEEYFEALKGSGFSSCAGIAIFHSHDPFSSVYKIAEECCESGKKRNRNVNIGNNRNFYIDFHYCRNGITGELKDIRQEEEAFTNLPYRWHSPDETDMEHDYEPFKKAGKELAGIGEDARGDVKNIIEARMRGESYYLMEVERLLVKYSRNAAIKAVLSDKKNEKPLFDACAHYDLWFASNI